VTEKPKTRHAVTRDGRGSGEKEKKKGERRVELLKGEKKRATGGGGWTQKA